VGEEQNFGVIFGFLLNFQHMIGHYRANSKAGSEKEIGYIDFIFIEILCDRISVLINEVEISYFMIFPNVLYGGIYQFGVDHIGLKHWQAFFGFELMINNGNNNHRKDEQYNGEGFVFGEKL
jgi:hypothetical protein